jgi:hypothetical protein
MRPLGRRSLFALPLVAPLAVAGGIAAVAKPLPGEWRAKSVRQVGQWVVLPELKMIDGGPFDRTLEYIRSEIDEIDARMFPSRANLAATLGIPHDEPRDWTDEDVAMTLGLDGIAVSAMAVRT